jgi:hypothetical protein
MPMWSGEVDLSPNWTIDCARRIQDRVLSASEAKELAACRSTNDDDRWVVRELWRRYQQGMLAQRDQAFATLVAASPKTWRTAARQAVPENDVWGKGGLKPPFEWQPTVTDYRLAICMARSQVGLGRPMLAFAVLEGVRPLAFADRFNTALAAAVAAEAFFATQRWEQCIEAAQSGLDAMRRQTSSSASDEPVGRPAEAALARHDLESLLARAQRELDMSRYGPAFVAYRDAERLRRFEFDDVGAYVAYQELIRSFPDSIFAEAARAYSIVSLAACVGNSQQAQRVAHANAITERIDRLTAALSDIKRAGGSPTAIAEQTAAINEQRRISNVIGSLPASGSEAGSRAMRMAEEFIAANEDGLYRCEAMMAIGDQFWEGRCDPAGAIPHYRRAYNWIVAIQGKERALDNFSLEPRCATVAAPPRSMRSTDAWGNSSWTKPPAGALVNHRNTDWYVDYWRIQAALRLVSCLIASGQGSAALEYLPVVSRSDPHQAVLAQRGWPTIERRLRDDIREGRLFATTAEMEAFPRSVMPRLLTAELAYETERYERAQQIYHQIREEGSGSLNASALAYLKYHEAMEVVSHDRQRALSLLREIAADRRVASWSRAKMDLFVMTQTMEADGGGALKHLDDIVAAKPNTPEAMRALYAKASFLSARRQYDLSRPILAFVKRTASESWLVAGATRLLLGIGPQ